MMCEDILKSLKTTQEAVFSCSEKTILPQVFSNKEKAGWKNGLDAIETAFQVSVIEKKFLDKLNLAENCHTKEECSSLDARYSIEKKVNQQKVQHLLETKQILQEKLKNIRKEIENSRNSIAEETKSIELTNNKTRKAGNSEKLA